MEEADADVLAMSNTAVLLCRTDRFVSVDFYLIKTRLLLFILYHICSTNTGIKHKGGEMSILPK